MRLTRILALALALVPLFALAGCGKSEKVVPVSGVATYKGEPLAFCTIAFTPTAASDPNLCIISAGKTDAEGRFELWTTEGEARKGAVVGPHRVSFKFMQWGTELDDEDGGKPAQEPPMLPKEYTSGTKVTFDVPAGGTDSANFDLD